MDIIKTKIPVITTKRNKSINNKIIILIKRKKN